MLRRSPLYALAAALLVAVTFALVRPAESAVVPVRIMALGDSITAGPGCWRAMLWRQLQTTGYTNIDFVGGVSDGGGCNPGYSYDWDHEGHGGYSATGIADNNQLPPWLSAARPDIVLMHLGTNDMWGHFIPTATKLTAFTKLVGQMRTNNATIKIIVAQIIPMSPSGCPTCAADVVELNAAVPGWAAGLTTAQSPIVVADLWTGFDVVADTVDGVHPGTTGFQKMGNRWYPALSRVLDGVVPQPTTSPTASPSPSPSRSPSASPSPSRSPSASASTTHSRTPSASASASPSASPTGGGRSCAASYAVTSQWGGAFQAEVTVRNTSTTASWNTTLGQSAATVTARNVAYNGTVAVGASTSLGFLATWNNVTNAVPAVSCTAS